jgi:hypothetical protein
MVPGAYEVPPLVHLIGIFGFNPPARGPPSKTHPVPNVVLHFGTNLAHFGSPTART